jgi:hypothetical protein
MKMKMALHVPHRGLLAWALFVLGGMWYIPILIITSHCHCRKRKNHSRMLELGV